jgi:hypothetical protein
MGFEKEGRTCLNGWTTETIEANNSIAGEGRGEVAPKS